MKVGAGRALVPARTQTQQIAAVHARAGAFSREGSPLSRAGDGADVARNGCRRAHSLKPQGGHRLPVYRKLPAVSTRSEPNPGNFACQRCLAGTRPVRGDTAVVSRSKNAAPEVSYSGDRQIPKQNPMGRDLEMTSAWARFSRWIPGPDDLVFGVCSGHAPDRRALTACSTTRERPGTCGSAARSSPRGPCRASTR